jgi:hypothetical protein
MPLSLNIALVFTPADTARLAAYSQTLTPLIGSDTVLGVNSHPHLTLLQFGAEIDAAQAAAQTIALPVPFIITVNQSYGHEGSGGLYWYGLEVVKTPALTAYPTMIWEKLGRPAMHNPIGDDYFPHITTGHGRKLSVIPAAENLFGDYTVHLAVGISGPQYQLDKIVWAA